MRHPDRRCAPRILHAFMVRYRLPALSEGPWGLAPLRDFSSRGARFMSEVTLKAGDGVELRLALPSSRQPVALRARVVWSKPTRFGVQEVGAVFAAPEARAQQVIDRTTAHCLRRQAKR